MIPPGSPPPAAGSQRGGGRDGTRREDRFPEPLAPGWFRPEELDAGALLRVAARVAGNLHWVDPEGRRSGSWADLYREDEAFVLTEMAALDPERLRASFQRVGWEGGEAERARRVRALAADMDRWMRVLRRSEHARSAGLAATLHDMVERELGVALRAADVVSPGGAKDRGEDRWSFLPVWEQAEKRDDGPTAGAEEEARAEAGVEEGWRALVNAAAYLAEPARSCLEEVRSSQRVPPAMALALAFVELLGETRAGLDAFPRRRLDFYYRQVLGMRPRDRRPDRAHLVVAPAAGVPSLVVPAGTRFSAPLGGEDRVYTADEDVVVGDARVVALRSLCYERDRLISPERELGFVTGVLGAASQAPDVREIGRGPAPAFGGAGAGNPWTSEGVGVGFAVASPVLELAEGRREVVFDLELGDPLEGPRRTVAEDVAALAGIPDGGAEDLFRRVGRIFSRALLSAAARGREPGSGDRAVLAPALAGRVLDEARRILDGEGPEEADSLGVLEDLFSRDAGILFHQLFRTALRVRLTGREGWEEASRVHVAPLPPGAARTGLRVELKLGPEAGPVVRRDPDVHGAGYGEGLPIVAFRVNPQAVFCPFSLLDALRLRAVEVEVTVDGVRDLVLHNSLGPLDPSRPFQPFGPMPTLESYLVVGSLEAARKKLVSAHLDVEWGDLPRAPGGFRQHYRLYGEEVTNDAFRVRVAVLRDGRWHPADPGRRPVEPVFETGDEGGGIAREAHIPLRVVEGFTPLSATATAEEFRALSRARQGLFRLSLSPSRATFGHHAYPRLLTEVLSRNARRRRKPEPIPDPPYTPVMTRISLGYTARATLRPGAAGQDGAGLFHDHPFGWERVGASGAEEAASLMPARPWTEGPEGHRRTRDGYLLLGLSGSRLAGPLALLFHLRPDATGQDGTEDEPDPLWFHLEGNRWRPLEPARVLGDGTRGFQGPGIVTLDLPEAGGAAGTVLPPGLRWVAVGMGRRRLSMVSRLLSVTAGAVAVTWQDDDAGARHLERGLPPGSITRALSPVAGLGSVTQVGASFGGRPAEDAEAMIARTAERLRHKGRAVSVWDWERLVLDRFPAVWKVKVFPATRMGTAGPAPGCVLVVVVPRPAPGEEDETPTPRLPSGELARIRSHLHDLASGFAHIQVRNPVYEGVQVRCTVKLAPGSRPGRCLQELNRSLVELISPWHPGGYGARFGWRIRRKEVEARLREIPWVELVTGFSLLQVTVDEGGHHALDDTARPPWDPDGAGLPPEVEPRELAARYPWSLAIPFRRHFIETTTRDVEIPAEVTGVGELEIGSNFILDAGRPHG